MDKPLVQNAADESQVAKATKHEKNDENRFREDMQTVLSSKQGRRILWRLIEECRVFESIYDPGNRVYYLAGRRDVGAMVMSWITNTSEDALIMMMKEAKELKELKNV